MAISMESAVLLHQDYLDICNPKTGRARDIPIVEEMQFVEYMRKDLNEAVGVIKLYLKTLQLATRALLQGELTKFDATVGDHACQVPASFAIEAFLDEELKLEAAQLEKIATEAIKKSGTLCCKVRTAPKDLIEKYGLSFQISKKMDYLVRAFFLHYGRELSVSRQGAISLRINLDRIQSQLSKCSTAVLEKIIIRAKEHMNQDSLRHVQELSCVLKAEERMCLQHPFIQSDTTPRGERLQFVCAFYNVKATLLSMVHKGIPFAISQYDPKGKIHHPPMIFKEEGVSLFPETPICIIEGFFKEGMLPSEVQSRIKEYGLIEFALANAAVYPQFIDMADAAYADDQDMASLPLERRGEIQQYREAGKKLGCKTDNPEFFKIVHIHAGILKDLQ